MPAAEPRPAKWRVALLAAAAICGLWLSGCGGSASDPGTSGAGGDAQAAGSGADRTADIGYGTWSGTAYVDVEVYDYCQDPDTLAYVRTDRYEHPVDIHVSEPWVHLDLGTEQAEDNPVHLEIQTGTLHAEGAFSLTSAAVTATGPSGRELLRDLLDVTVDGATMMATVKNSADGFLANVAYQTQSSDPCGIAGSAVETVQAVNFADGNVVELRFSQNGGYLGGRAELSTLRGSRLLRIQFNAERSG